MQFTKAVLLASDLPVLVTAVFTLINYPKFERKIKIFSLFIFFSALVQIIALVYWLLKKNNLPLLHVYVPVGFGLLACFYQALLDEFINKRIIAITVLLFFCFSVANTIFYQSIFTFNSVALTVEAILIIILSIFTFIVHLNHRIHLTKQPSSQSINWINSALFIYYSSTLLIFYFGDYIMRFRSVHASAYTWMLHSFSSVVMYCCFLIGLWKQVKQSR